MDNVVSDIGNMEGTAAIESSHQNKIAVGQNLTNHMLYDIDHHFD